MRYITRDISERVSYQRRCWLAILLNFIDKSAKAGTISHVFETCFICRGSSVVEREPEELGVGGSIPPPGTSLRLSVLSGSADFAWRSQYSLLRECQ